MKKKTILVTSTVVLFVAALFGVPAVKEAQAHPSSFPDVIEINPAHDAIEALAARGVSLEAGGGSFQPNSPLRRAEAAMLLVAWRGVERQTTSLTPRFQDVDSTDQPYVETALVEGWMSGFPDGTFRPRASLTRQQMAVVIIRVLGLERTALSLTPSQMTNALNPFLDESGIADSAQQYVALAVRHRLFAGDTGFFSPSDALTRAQFSLVLYRADILARNLADGTADPDGEDLGFESAEVANGGTVAQAQSFTPSELALAEFLDTYMFQPHNSPVTGQMVVRNTRLYGIPPLSQLVIMAAETSLGDPKLGGVLARHNNFGCMRYHGASTFWGQLSNGRIWVAGKDWYSFPSPEVGMAAWGRYLSTAMNGFYLPILTSYSPDWAQFAAVYYGRGVAGYWNYVNRLEAIENRFRARAAQHGVSL